MQWIMHIQSGGIGEPFRNERHVITIEFHETQEAEVNVILLIGL